MGRRSIRLMLVAAALLAAGTVARTTPWISGGTGERPQSAAETSRTEGVSTGSQAAGDLSPIARDSAAPNGAEPVAPTPALGETGPLGTEAGAGDRIAITRDDWEAFASAVIETAAQASAPILAVAVPTPVLLGNANTPMFVTAIPGDERIFVVERAGRIRILMPDGSFRSFMDITSRVGGLADEGGLLSMAFPPDHAETGLFYVYYTDRQSPMNSILARFPLRDGDPNVGNPNREDIVLSVEQDFGNHNGGTIAFSPEDGYLYWGLGDGGGTNDPNNRAQDGNSLLGSMLRIDVSGGSGSTYTVPPTNPFVGNTQVRNEIWSLGLRNPFRFSFDSGLFDMWIGDVGQNQQEEIDFEPKLMGGRNYEWDIREGDLAYQPTTPGPGTIQPPELVYDHTPGCNSVTGGIVYRGPTSALTGLYHYADYCRNQVWQYDPATPAVDPLDVTGDFGAATSGIVAFGEDGFGGMLVVLISGGIYRVGGTGNQCDNANFDDDGDGLSDFPDDEGCLSPTDPSEWDPDVACDDGIDNDLDGDIDGADVKCTDLTSDAELPPPAPDSDDGSSSSGCGLGFELVLLVPLWGWARRRRGRTTH